MFFNFSIPDLIFKGIYLKFCVDAQGYLTYVFF